MAQGIGGRGLTPEDMEALNQPAAAAQASSSPQPQEDKVYTKEGDFDRIKAPGDFSNPYADEKSESYDPNTDAGFHVLRGIKNVTGIDLGVDNYVQRQSTGTETLTDTIASESVNALAGGVLDLVENTAEGVNLLVDGVKGEWGENYVAADYDFGIAENKTLAGNFARDMVRVMAASTGAGMVGQAAGLSGGAAVALDRGTEFFVDFFAAPGEGNLSNMVEDSPFNNWLSQALAHDEEDNQWIADCVTP